jgi:hypothetical protein
MEHKELSMKRGTVLALLVVALAVGCGAPPPRVEAPAISPTEEQNISQPAVTLTPYPTYTPYPTQTPYPTYTPYPTDVPLSTATPAATLTPAVEATAMATSVPTEAVTEVADGSQTLPVLASAPVTSGAAGVSLERIPDTDPAPPFTILVDAIRIQEDGKYRVTGRVRNDGAETYEGVGVHASFLDAYHLHPLGQPVEYRQPAPLVLSGLVVFNDGIGNVRMTGTATNGNPFVVRDPTVAGTLVDSSGRTVSVGSASVLGDVAPGESVSFDVRVKYAPYSTYKLQYTKSTFLSIEGDLL